MEVVFSLEEIDKVAQLILDQNPNKVVLFKGNMGVGKTTLIKSLSQKLGVKGNTSSPTFSLVNEYQITDNHIVYHFDCYRLKTEVEALDIGIDDYLYSGNWCFIEWPEKIQSLIPEKCSIINIEILPNGFRKLIFLNNFDK